MLLNTTPLLLPPTKAVYYIVNGVVFLRMQLTLSINSRLKVCTIFCVVTVNIIVIFFSLTPFFPCCWVLLSINIYDELIMGCISINFCVLVFVVIGNFIDQFRF